ncbi:hypothetical protein BDV26DRAFT_16993 [Aspergillus bertholletiae]|uniref:Uncharacterized protein n=1 Tax=Aspergillus bertholletiae TaxID=1226010 RepID=A0A5N7BKT3_9EURO|nr:hypothetical protein BDV26DRAFT_16993 [Aspergillus bertholletiae]
MLTGPQECFTALGKQRIGGAAIYIYIYLELRSTLCTTSISASNLCVKLRSIFAILAFPHRAFLSLLFTLYPFFFPL